MSYSRCVACFLNLALLCVGWYLAGERSAYAQGTEALQENQSSQSRAFTTTTDCAESFTDNFEDGVADGWSPRNASRWNVTSDAGSRRYFLNTTNYHADSGERLGEYSIISGKNFDDFTFECKAKSWDAAVGNENPDLAVVFGYQNDDNYYYVVFNGAPGLTSIVLIQNRMPRTLATYSGSTFLDGQYHTIAVERRGDEILVSFDGTQIMSARDATFRSGGIGVGSYNDSGYFDDVSVTGPGGPAQRFTDNFEDGVADGWNPRNASRWNVTSDGGSRRYFLNTTNYHADSGERLGEYSIITGQSFDDFTFECKAKSWDAAAGNENPDLAVVFGYQNDDNYYYAVFNGAPGLTSIVLIQNRTPRTLATYSGSTFLDGQYHTIGVERQGDEILVSFDGTQILSAREASFRSGGIGVGSYNDSGYFDDVSVTGPACTPGTVEITFRQEVTNNNILNVLSDSTVQPERSSWLLVDGVFYSGTAIFNWQPGSQHTVVANPLIPESPCLTRELFQRWDDGGSRSRVIVVPNTNRIYRAIYERQARFRLHQSAGGRATQSLAVSSDDYYTIGSNLVCEAIPDSGIVFRWWEALHRGNVETGPTFYSSANPLQIGLGCWIDLYPVFGRDTTITTIRSGTPASPSIYDISDAGDGSATMKIYNDERWLTVEYAFYDVSELIPSDAIDYGMNNSGNGRCESSYVRASTYHGGTYWTSANCCHPDHCSDDPEEPRCFDSVNHASSSSTDSGYVITKTSFLINPDHPVRMLPPRQIFFSGRIAGVPFNFPPSTSWQDCSTWPSFELSSPPCDSAQTFTDNFEDGAADGWTPRNASRWEVTSDAGSQRYFLNTTNYNADSGERLGEYSIISGQTFDDFTFECRAKSWDAAIDNENPDLAVVFGYQNDDNYYYAVFNGAPSLTSIVLIQNRTPRTLATYSGSTFLDGQYHTIGVERRGDEILVSFDGTQIMSARDATFSSGGIGVASYNDSGYFDDIVVRSSCPPGQPTIALPANLSGAPGDTLQIPVEVSTSENIGIAQFTIDYNGDVLAFLNASIGPDAPGFSVSQVNSNPQFPPTTPGTNRNLLVQISGGSSGSFTGENRLVLLLRFRITGTSGTNSPLGFDRECTRTFLSTTDFRDLCGNAVTTNDGSVVVSQLAAISGQVQFYNGNRPVANAVLTLRGATTRSQSSDAAGRYRFDNVNPGNYSLEPSKSGDWRNAISGSDAVALLQIIGFVLNPTPGQRITGDVDRNGNLSGADAVALLRYLAFLPSGTANVGQWRFQPASPSLTVSADVSQDFTAYLLGDVTGNWNASNMVLAAAAQRFDVAFDDARVSGDSLRLALRVPGDAGALHSLQASIAWQGTMGAAHFQAARPDIIGVVNNSEGGTTHLALATAAGVASGELIGELVVPVASSQARTTGMAAAGEVTALVVNDVALHGTELRLAGGGMVPDDFVLLQNYPNPFNIHTSIRFGVPSHGAEDEVVLEIFTLQGQRVRELQREPMSPGYHTVVWDGRDDHGRLVGSGVYLFRLRAGAIRQSSKLLLLK